MQIPFLNMLIRWASFAPLLGFQDSPAWERVLRSFILAFWFGFLPAGLDAFSRYRLRKKYANKILRVKYRVGKLDAI